MLDGGTCLDYNFRAPYCSNAHEIIRTYMRSKKRARELKLQSRRSKFIKYITVRPLPRKISSTFRYIVNSTVWLKGQSKNRNMMLSFGYYIW